MGKGRKRNHQDNGPREGVGTSSSSSDTRLAGETGEPSDPDGVLIYVEEPARRRVTQEMAESLERAGFIEAAEVAKKLAS
jgi:hypothetical protein